jgi:flagellin-like hook-associated protein FlgL
MLIAGGQKAVQGLRMTINIQGSTSALAMLEALTSQSSAASAANAGASTSLLDATSSDSTAASIIDLSGGATSALSGLSAGLSNSASIADAGAAAGTSIVSLLSQMRQDAVTASNPDIGTDTLAALNAGFQSDLQQIAAAVSSAQVGGVNLIDGSVSGRASSQQAPGASLTGVNLSLGGPLIGLSPAASLSDPVTAASLSDQLGTAIDHVGQAVSQISAQSDAIQANLALVAQAGLSSSGSSLVNPNLDGDGARLAALQVQQQLSIGGESIGNQAPQTILSLFR